MKKKFIGAASSQKAYFAAATATVVLFTSNYVPHTFGIDYYRKFFQCYKNGEPVPISAKVQERLERAKAICGLAPNDRQIVTPFAVFGFDTTLAGCTKSRFGAIIGVPTNYEYDSISDIKRSEIRFRDQEINWNSVSGSFLEESLILTEDEQIFAFCKEILQAKTHYVLMNSLFPTLSFVSVYTVGSYLNSSLGLLARPFALLLMMYAILGLFGFGSWCFLKDYSQVSRDSDIDKELCAKGPQFVQAGIGYYDKQLKKNVALRNLLKDDTFTAKGNINYSVRQQSMPLTVRKSFFESQLGEEAALN